MATLSKQGNEVIRYLSTKRRGLISVRDNGTILRKTPFSPTWKIVARKKPEVTDARWIEINRELYDKLRPWQRVTRIPSYTTIQRWSYDGISETPLGNRVEPDGFDHEGAPAWTLFFGLL